MHIIIFLPRRTPCKGIEKYLNSQVRIDCSCKNKNAAYKFFNLLFTGIFFGGNNMLKYLETTEIWVIKLSQLF